MIEINKCRIGHKASFKTIIDLGEQALTGVFPSTPLKMKKYPLILVKCSYCGLVQLKNEFDKKILFGDTYGYRSGLNQSMVNHLQGIVKKIEKIVNITDDDHVVDIGSNDGTLLKAYKRGMRMGFEPIMKFHQYYNDNIKVWPYFFPESSPFLKCTVITSIAMFYDINDPIRFMKQIYECLSDDGIWVFEVAFWPTTLKNTSYDTICHEHACYYDLPQIKYLCKRSKLQIIDTTYNDTNGGSICVTVRKKS